MKPAIRVENLSKCYQIGASAGGYRTLRESIVDAVQLPYRRLRRWLSGPAPEETALTTHWALRDVSFEVQPGEIIGIIGPNGAGKSTLLKILSRITEPTSGRAELRGRVNSLLEVGTGFHSELTGRENIYMNGAILGMTRREIDRKFDDIVAFSEIGKFLDTPAKRYSSGMYIRLAFAVAAHLDAELLVVDEVLAVGDSSFQKKCLDRIRSLGQSGATVLFVSHNMGTVASLCHRALILEHGSMVGEGPAREQVSRYLSTLRERTGTDLAERTDRTGNGAARVVAIRLLDGRGQPCDSVLAGEPLTIRFVYRAPGPLPSVEIFAWLNDDHGNRVTVLSNRFNGDLLEGLPAEGCIDCTIPEVALSPAPYRLDYRLCVALDDADVLASAARLEVEPGPFFSTGRTPESYHGPALTRHLWSFRDGAG
jgi:lipopolysaccharide transport system ATP-binding protein